MAGPLEQFEIKTLIPISTGAQAGAEAALDLSFTNSSLAMVLAVVLASMLMIFSMRGRAQIPGRAQALTEVLYEFIADTLKTAAGKDAMRYFPFVFSIFMFILFGNLLGMVPVFFTFTSHIIVTFALGMLVFLVVTGIGFARHGLKFFGLFLPHGVPKILAPMIVCIELISYLIRPATLAVRLFANMLAGHILLKIFALFTVNLLAFGFIGLIGGVVPLAVNVALIALEFFVAMLQAFIFTLLTCVYLNDALNLH